MATANLKSTTKTEEKESELQASKAAVSEAYDKLIEAKDHFQKAARSAGVDAKHDALDQYEKGRKKAGELTDQATDYMRKKPLATVGIAFAAGFLISKVLTRK